MIEPVNSESPPPPPIIIIIDVARIIEVVDHKRSTMFSDTHEVQGQHK